MALVNSKWEEFRESEKLLINDDSIPPPSHSRERSFHNVLSDLIVVILTTAEVSLVLYLSITHFMDAKSLQSILMLAPIFFNIIGTNYFLSNKDERWLFENIGITKCTSDIYQLPLFGSVFTALKIFSITCGCCKISKKQEISFGRFHASAIKMRICVTYFSVTLECIVQMTNCLITMNDHLTLENWLEIATIIVGLLILAEDNAYGLVSNYYRIFREYTDKDWIVNVSFCRHLLLFIHSLSSIGSRLMASSLIYSSAEYYFKEEFGVSTAVIILIQILYKICFYYIFRFVKYCSMRRKEIPSSCYESINYGWRSTILDFGFQSKNDFVQIYFYLENIAAYALWLFVVRIYAPDWIRDELSVPVTIIYWSFNLVSIASILICQRFDLAHLRGLA